MAISKEEQARREHNEVVREKRRKYNTQVGKARSKIKDLKKGLETQVPLQVLKIMSGIVDDQNNGVPLSDFQKDMIRRLEKEFSAIDKDELKRPRLVKREDGMYLKDVAVKTPEGTTNYVDIKTPNAYENQTVETMLSLGVSTFELIEMISDVVSENARLVEELNKSKGKKTKKESEQKLYPQEQRQNKDKFEARMMTLEELVANSKVRDKEERRKVYKALKSIRGQYGAVKDTTLTPYSDQGKTWIGNVPIVNHGDVENIDPKADTVDASTKRKEMFEVDYNLSKDVKLVQKLPKNITEQLIEVLSRLIKENSELHNELYKADKIQRKFPWKSVGLIMAALVAAGVAVGSAFDFLNKNKSQGASQDSETKIEDVSGDKILEENKEYYPYTIEDYIRNAEEAHDQMVSYRGNIESSAVADDIYQKEAGYWKDHINEEYDASTYLGEDFDKIGYSKMLQESKAILDILKSDKTTNFIEYLKEKSRNKEALTQEEYANYEKLYNYANKFSSTLQVLENGILFNNDFQKILDDEKIEITEQAKDRLAANIGFLLGGSVVGIALGAGGLAIIQNAKKKEAKREAEREKEGGMEA